MNDNQNCKDESLLLETLQNGINLEDIDLIKQAIKNGAKPELLYISAIRELNNTQILQLLIENGFNIHVEKNKIMTEWMGSSTTGGWRNSKPPKHHILSFISSYYLKKPNLIEKFSTLLEKTLLFRIGLENNNFDIMKFAFTIGANKNEALNSTLYRYYSKNHGNNKTTEVDFEIIEYMLNSNMKFEKITISNAVFFKYTALLDALDNREDLEYGYEMAYNYENDDLCKYFINRGVCAEAQNLARMKISAIKGDIKGLRKAVNDGAKIKDIDKEIIIETINNNQIEILKYLNDSGLVLEISLNQYLNKALSDYDAYETVSYLIEQGLDITNVKSIPREYKKKYPAIAHMWEEKFTDIFDYTVYLASELHPKLEGKEKDEILQRIAQLSTLPYVIKCSQGKTND